MQTQAALTLVWAACLAAGSLLLVSHEFSPGASAAAPAGWPQDTALELSASTPTLLLFAHPRCPCTAATISELDRFLSRRGSGFSSTIVFVRPESVQEAWAHTANVAAARRIPSTQILFDDGGLAEAFGAKTSGTAFVFDTIGVLRYQGGLTASRGHEGLNAGIEALESIASGRPPAVQTLPVFGCGLFSAHAARSPR